jgi:hypothetical protein
VNTKKLAQRLVDALIGDLEQEDANFRAFCGWCEKEFGPVPVPYSVAKSHTFCQRHYEQMCDSAGIKPETYARHNFAPDLGELSPEERKDYRKASTDRGVQKRTKLQPMVSGHNFQFASSR